MDEPKGVVAEELRTREAPSGEAARSPQVLRLVLGSVGGVIGAGVGMFAFGWILGQGFYAIILPGACVGLGARLLARRGSVPLGLICLVLAFVAGVFSEWRYLPFMVDDSLGYFLRHLGDVKPITWIMIGLGTAAGYYFTARE